MKTPDFEPDIAMNNKTRLFTTLLGLLIFIGLLLISASASSAQGQAPQANRADFSSNGTELYYSQQLTDTVTATPTVTLTPTATELATTTATATSTATETPTPTSTTSPGNTPTSSPTATDTPTITGTPPTITPTSTATVNPGATISVSVSPSSARVNETLTFTIKVGNTSDITTVDNIIVDSFPTFIDVISVSFTGTVTKGTHSFIATIGNVDPDEIVTITAVVRVNSTLSRSENLSNVVTLTYDQRGSKNASVAYRVVYTSLPGTGDLPLNWRQDGSKSRSSLPGILLIVFGGTLLGLVRWTKARVHKDRLWMTISGTLLILAGFIVMVTSLGLFNETGGTPIEQSYQAGDGSVVDAQSAEPSATSLVWQPASAFSTPDSVIPIVTLPDYPIPTPVLTFTPRPGEASPDTTAVLRIIIPALLLDTDVKYVPYDGYTWLINGLRQEIAWMGNTSWPGLGSNTGLAGHVTVAGLGDGPFRHLDELPMGEVIILYTEQNIYTYQVSERKITDDGDMSVIKPTDNSQISLITCIDWDDATKSYLNRLVVVADLIRTEPITMGLSR